MPNGETAAATGAVNRGSASRIGYVSGGEYTRVASSKPKGYSTSRSQTAAKNYMKERGMPIPSDRQVSRTHQNFVNSSKKSKKGKKKAKAKAKKTA